VGYVVLTVNSQRKPYCYIIFVLFIGFICDFIDFLCEFTVKTTEHTVASYESSDFTCKSLSVSVKKLPKF
jgi:hypothetical protein